MWIGAALPAAWPCSRSAMEILLCLRCFDTQVGVKMLKSVEIEVFFLLCFQISAYEDSVAAHLAKILNSDQHSVVISSAK